MQRATTGGPNNRKQPLEERTFQLIQVDPEKGEITAFGERFLLMSSNVLYSIEDKLSQLLDPPTAITFLYEIGKQAGRDSVRLTKRLGNPLKNTEDAQAAAEMLGTMGGWGRLTVVDFEPSNAFIRLRWTNGVTMRARDGKVPVCHFLRGIFTGGAEEVFGRRCDSIETMCQGKGDKYCEAIFADQAMVTMVAEKMAYVNSSKAQAQH